MNSKPEEAIYGKTNYDILFLGNSKIHTGLNPYYIDSVTKLNSYNLAMSGGDEQEMKLLSTVYLQHHLPPKIVIIGIDNSMLLKYNMLKERFQYLFYLHNDTIKSYMKKNGFPSSLIEMLPFTKYSFFDEYNRASVFIGNGEITRKIKHNIYKGFWNVFPQLNSDSVIARKLKEREPQFYNTLSGSGKINDTSLATISQTIDMFIHKGTRVVFLQTPAGKKDSLSAGDQFYSRLANKYNIPIVRADTVKIFTKKYFVDDFHLNEPGSEILSLFVADIINKMQ